MAEQACAFAGRVDGAVAATERQALWMEALRAAGIWTGIRKTLVCPRRSSAKRRTARTGTAMVIAGFVDACRFVRSWMFHRDEISRLRGRCRVLPTRTVYATSAPRETVLGPVILTNLALAREYLDRVFNAHRPELAAEYLTPHVRWHGGTLGTIEGPDNVLALLQGFIGGLPDLSAFEQDALAQGDLVAMRFVIDAATCSTSHTRPSRVSVGR